MDLVKIGFLIKADGLKDANTEVEKLLTKVDNIGTKGKKAATDFESSQTKVASASKKATKEVDATTKALEKQRLVGGYLAQGYNKTTASAAASLKLMGANVSQVDTLLSQIGKNEGILKLRKDTEQLYKTFDNISKTSTKKMGGGILDTIGFKEQDLVNLNNQYRQLENNVKERGQAIYKQFDSLSKTSTKGLGGGFLDQIGFQHSDLINLNNQYREAERIVKERSDAIYQQFEKTSQFSSKNLGGGVLDQVSTKNTDLEQMRKMYQEDARLAAEKEKLDTANRLKREKAAQTEHQANLARLEKEKQAALKAEREKAATLAKADLTSKYVSQGYGKTDAAKLARLELSGADVTTLNNYKKAINETNQALAAMRPVAVQAEESNNKLLASIKGIAAYALLSTAIYGVITATSALGVATVKMADEYTAIQNRMKLYIKDTQELSKVNSQLAQFSVENNVGLRETATLFTRLVPAMQKIGANTAAVTSVVDAFGKSMRIGGATAMEAASATIQFSQAMASGKLAGDEFRSISEASPRFLKAIAEGSDIAAEKLKEMSSAGMLTTEVISKALLKEYPKLIEENKKLGITLEQGANAIKTGFLVAVGEFNEGAKVTEALGESMVDLAKSMFTVGQGAREMGQDVNAWFKENSGTIQTVVEAFKILTAVIVSRYVAAIVLARIESLRYQATLLSMAAAQAGAARSATLMSIAIAGVGNAMKGVLAFFGGWVGLALTVAGTVASYVLFNKESEKTTESLRKEGESIDQAVAKYKELSRVKQLEQMVSEKKTVSDLTKAYNDQKQALVSSVLQISRHNDMTSEQAQSLSSLGLQYKEGKISLSQLSQEINKSTVISQQGKDDFNLLAGGVETAGKKALDAEKLIKVLLGTTKDAGDEAEIAGSKFDKFLQDAENVTKTNQIALRYMKAFNLDQTKAIDLAKLDLALRSQGKYATIDHVKALQEQQKSEEDLAAVTQSRNKAEKDLNKTRKESDRDLKKFQNQVIEMTTYYDVLQSVNNMEVARIASQKEYLSIYKDNLAVANELAIIQEKTLQAEARIEFEKALRIEEEAHTRIVALMKQGADYETAKAVAAAKFTDDMRGREAAELAITNALYNQQASLSDQLAQQQNINKYLKDGLGLEEATLRTTLARIAALGNNTNDHEELRRNYEAGLQLLRVAKATADSQVKINALTREAALLTTTMANGYGASGVAAAKLAASTVGLLYSQAELQVKKQEEVDLLNESINTYLTLNSLLSDESQTLREVKATYSTISNEEAKRVETSRKALTIAEAYVEKLKEQKNIPIGDFSNVDFEVFGNFGNPFKEALDGLNAYVSGMTNLDEKIKTVQESMRQYQAEAELASLQGQTQRSQQLLDLANKQIAVEKDLQKEKAATIDIAYGQGLKVAKSFFKEESKGYKIINALEIALQAKKIAFAIWEKKDSLDVFATKIAGYAKDTIAFVTGTATKIGAQMGLNVAQAQGAVASAANAPPPVGFASAAAMIALLAGIGIAISGGGSSGSFEAANNGTGTVFGDTEAQSKSISKSIELLSQNSDLMLPLTSAMLRSLRNIESNIGGVTNLILRQATGGEGFNIQEGFNQNGFGSILQKSIEGTFKVLFLGDFLGIGKALGGLLGGLFGSKTTVKGSGLFADTQKLGDIITKGFDLFEYVDVQIKKKAFGVTTSTKNRTKKSAADAALENQFTLIFSGFYDSILKASTSLGANMDTVKGNLENAVIRLGKIDLKGLKGDEIQEKLEAVFGAAADSLAQQGFAGLEDFQTVGEGYYETLIKVATGVEQAAYFTDRLNVTAIDYTQILNKQGDVAAEIVRQSVLLTDKTKDIAGGFYELVNNFEGTAEELTDFVLTLRDLQDQLFMTGKNADYLTSAMILGAGGLESLASGLDAYFEMLSPAEQAAELTRRLTNEFAIFGKELPADVKAFRNLVNSIDISTEAGQKLYGQILALAPEFNDLQDALNSANSDVNALVQSLRDLAEQARAARGETEQPRNLAFLRNEFERASILAMQGDTEAANRLLTLGKDLMQVSKLYALSGSEYTKDLALIQRAATVAADIQANGLGTSISPTLTPSTNTTTTPTVETTNTSTDEKLNVLSEKLEAGLFAIAKYTQDTANRLERWDYGDRVLVRVEQDGNADAIPTKVV